MTLSPCCNAQQIITTGVDICSQCGAIISNIKPMEIYPKCTHPQHGYSEHKCDSFIDGDLIDDNEIDQKKINEIIDSAPMPALHLEAYTKSQVIEILSKQKTYIKHVITKNNVANN